MIGTPVRQRADAGLSGTAGDESSDGENGDSQEDDGSDDGEDDSDEEENESEDDEADESLRLDPAYFKKPLEPLVERLIPPPEVVINILSLMGRRFETQSDQDREWLWLDGRLISRTWKDWIEKRAREEWMASARFTSDGGMIRVAGNKVIVSSTLDFSHFEGDDLAVFEQKDVPEEYLRLTQRHLNGVKVMDAHFGGYIHDLPITGLQRSTTALRLTVPYRNLLSQLCSEERTSNTHFETKTLPGIKDWTTASRIAIDNGEMDIMEQMMDLMDKFGNGRFDAYVQVRKLRRGRSDPEGDERLKMLRYAQGFEGLEDDVGSDDGEESS
ncbi:hypothetical protein RQP46_011385 [Phenoliferia psychrophenolica]